MEPMGADLSHWLSLIGLFFAATVGPFLLLALWRRIRRKHAPG